MKRKMNNILIEKYEVLWEKPNFEENYCSRTAVGIYKTWHNSIGLMNFMKWLIYYDRSYYDKLNYFDLMGSLGKYLMLNEIPGR